MRFLEVALYFKKSICILFLRRLSKQRVYIDQQRNIKFSWEARRSIAERGDVSRYHIQIQRQKSRFLTSQWKDRTECLEQHHDRK